jgi:hypothetical protein
MSTQWIDLEFGGGDVEKGQLPGFAAAHIVVKQATTDEDGQAVYLSNQCLGPTELEWEVARLKQELNEILVKGRRAFRDYESRTHEAIRRKQALRAGASSARGEGQHPGPDANPVP